MKKPSIAVVVGCLVAAAAMFGAFLALPFVRKAIHTEQNTRRSAAREPAAKEQWRLEFGDPAERLRAFPSRAEDEAAARVVEMARSLGIDMARPKPGALVSRPAEPYRSVAEAVPSYLDAELTSSGDRAGAPPGVLRDFLETHSAELDSLVVFLAGRREPPVWVSAVSLGPEASIPNLLGQIRLQKLLVADCLYSLHGGRTDNAERVLLASWNLNASIRDRPDVISQLIAIAVARMQSGVARRIFLAGPWRDRLAAHDYRASFLQAMEVDAAGRFWRIPGGPSRAERAMRADYLDLSRVFLVSLRDLPVADGPLVPARLEGEAGESPGGVLARIGMPNLVEAVRRADRLMVDAELTDRILEARELEASVGHWAAEAPRDGASRMPGARWIYSVGSDGRLTISLSRELHWDVESGLLLPLCHVLEPNLPAPPR
ncbi:MAG: hypothetical protein M3167_08045 [Acidobacteriota bacterium]|nr:hypothetical protein [Acidobacteriota bacterium]